MMKTFIKTFFSIFFGFLLLLEGASFAQTPNQEQLTRIEQEIWGLNYENDSDDIRIERIEKRIFGTTNPKLTPEKRIDKISQTLGIETYAEAKSSLSDLYVVQEAGEGVEYPQIDSLEKALLGQMYKNENIYKRLERLEKKVFGTKQEGELAERTETLKRHASLIEGYNSDKIGSLPSQTYENYAVNEADVKIQLSAIENMVFGMDFSQEPVQLRLNRLENRIFQRGFDDDDNGTRIARLQAAATAKKTSKYYDNNKFQKFASTGIQAASFILMILALIL